jgi:hypothetical protein
MMGNESEALVDCSPILFASSHRCLQSYACDQGYNGTVTATCHADNSWSFDGACTVVGDGFAGIIMFPAIKSCSCVLIQSLPCGISFNITCVRECCRPASAAQLACPALQVTGIPGVTSYVIPASTSNIYLVFDDSTAAVSCTFPSCILLMAVTMGMYSRLCLML